MLTRVARRLRRVELEVVVREPARRTAVGRRRDQPEARQRILDAAEAQFAQDGFDATPTARIAEQAGVPKGLLLAERLPVAPLCAVTGVVRGGDIAGSLLRLARNLGLGQHESVVLRTIIFREAGTHPEVREHLRVLREGLLNLTESVLDLAAPRALDPNRRRQAAQTYVAVMLDEANARRFDGPLPDLEGAARIVSAGLVAT